MIKTKVVLDRLEALKNYNTKLKELQKLTLEDIKNNYSNEWSVEHGLQLAVECLMDVGNHLIAALGLEKPKDYTEIIIILGKEGIIPKDFSEKIKWLPGFRNILIHDYLYLDLQKVYDNLQKAPELFVAFSKYILEFLRKKDLLE